MPARGRVAHVAIERDVFLASLRAPATQALLADARRLLASAEFPPADPNELRY